MLRSLIEPAVSSRAVRCSFYAHQSWSETEHVVEKFVAALETHGAVRLYWYKGPSYDSLMHAKFCVADGALGYFGSANFTSSGFRKHIEMGVKLSAGQCHQLLAFLDGLTDAGLFEAVK